MIRYRNMYQRKSCKICAGMHRTSSNIDAVMDAGTYPIPKELGIITNWHFASLKDDAGIEFQVYREPPEQEYLNDGIVGNKYIFVTYNGAGKIQMYTLCYGSISCDVNTDGFLKGVKPEDVILKIYHEIYRRYDLLPEYEKRKLDPDFTEEDFDFGECEDFSVFEDSESFE